MRFFPTGHVIEGFGIVSRIMTDEMHCGMCRGWKLPMAVSGVDLINDTFFLLFVDGWRLAGSEDVSEEKVQQVPQHVRTRELLVYDVSE